MNCEHLEQQLAELPLYGYFFLKTGEFNLYGPGPVDLPARMPNVWENLGLPSSRGYCGILPVQVPGLSQRTLICTVTEVDDISDISATLAT